MTIHQFRVPQRNQVCSRQPLKDEHEAQWLQKRCETEKALEASPLWPTCTSDTENRRAAAACQSRTQGVELGAPFGAGPLDFYRAYKGPRLLETSPIAETGLKKTYTFQYLQQ